MNGVTQQTAANAEESAAAAEELSAQAATMQGIVAGFRLDDATPAARRRSAVPTSVPSPFADANVGIAPGARAAAHAQLRRRGHALV
jgi:hypothetical protein